ncbi:MAG: beta-glucosidase [Akkermansiaceae bacterium]|nr:beta-glucosidase [Akkermansiaceae bacterium]
MTRVLPLRVDFLRNRPLRSLLLAVACSTGSLPISTIFAEEATIPDNETQVDPSTWLRPIPENLAASDLRGILYERWNDVPGAMVRDLLQSPQFKQAATNRGLADVLEFPSGDGKDFGIRARGYIVPQRSGKVRFFLSSDDNAELWLSPNNDPFSKQKICWLTGPGWFGSSPRDLTNRISTQLSAPVDVVAGRPYYFEGYHKEASGDDHFEVYWQYEDDKDPVSIPNESLRPYAGNPADADDDGLPDLWQTQNGLDGNAARAWWEDADGDLVSNYDEYLGHTAPLDNGPVQGALLFETWYGTVGSDVADLLRDPRFKEAAHRSVFLTEGSITPKSDASFNGTRLSGCLVPKESGDYELAVAGDDAAELWLSTDECPLNKVRVAFNDHWRGKTPEEEWAAVPAQQAVSRHLEAGQAYYFEVLQKDKLAPGWSALGWRKKGEAAYYKVTPEFLQSPGIDPQDPDRTFLPQAWAQQSQARVAQRRSLAGEETPPAPDLTEHGDPDHDGLENWQEAKLGTDPYTRTSAPGALIREWWFNIPGVSLLRTRQNGVFLQPPSMRTLTDGSVAEANTVDYFASRLRGQVTAPVAGTYRFWIAGDDHCELWLSDDGTKFAKRKIAWITPETWESPDTDAWTNPQEWDSRPQQESEMIELEEGESRFLEILHKEAGDKDHVEIAWQYKRHGSSVWSARNLIPSAALSSYAGDDDDLDDDYLPDSWEIAKGLDPADNGGKDHDKQGEDGDFDHDGLTNREEYLRGTDPCNADSDGDGVGDYDEIHLYGSDPTKKDASPPVKDRDFPLADYHAAPGQWFLTDAGTLISLTRRGPVDLSFNLDTAGVFVVQLDARISTQDAYSPPIPVIVSVDGRQLGSGEVVREGNTLRWLTPWLSAGNHTVTVNNRNTRLGRALEITGLSLYRHEGEDLNQNGIPDWMEGLFKNLDGINPGYSESITSPQCVEGVWRFAGTAKLTANGEEVAAQPGLSGHWFANVPLSFSGDTAFAATFEDGAITKQSTFHWINTDLFTAPDVITVRSGDSLKLTAIPTGTDGSATHVTYTLADQAVGEAGGAEPTAVKFDQPGTFTLTAHTVTGTETVDAAISIKVVKADFGADFSLASGTPRVWNLPGIDKALTLESDKELSLQEIERQDGQSRQFTASYVAGKSGSPVVLARLFPNGPIVGSTSVDAFYIVPATQSLDAREVQVLPDGTRVLEFGLMIDGKIPADLSIWLDFYVTDAVFADGTTRYHLTAADFDENGIARIQVYKAPGVGTPWICHYIRPYYDDPGAAGAAGGGTTNTGGQ